MKYPLKILIVEDSPTDRELLRYLLEARFKDVRLFEADTLASALVLADHCQPSCVILDLQLPDSIGKNTFLKLYEHLPRTTPVIVMTHNKDRQLALEMIQTGAADYVLKNYTEDEDLFQRILFAIEKHERTVHIKPDDARAINRLEKVRASVAIAKRSNSVPNMYAANMDAAEAVAEASQRMITELSKVTGQMTEIAKSQVQHSVIQDNLLKTVEALENELLRGHPTRPSMRSQVDLLGHRLNAVESGEQALKNAVTGLQDSQHKSALEVKTTQITSKTKVLLGILALVGAIATAVATYEAGKAKDSVKVEEKK